MIIWPHELYRSLKHNRRQKKLICDNSWDNHAKADTNFIFQVTCFQPLLCASSNQLSYLRQMLHPPANNVNSVLSHQPIYVLSSLVSDLLTSDFSSIIIINITFLPDHPDQMLGTIEPGAHYKYRTD
jgi:hypothetical protein